jgi:hypothetical protein
MEHRYGAKDFVTSQDTSLLPAGTYYLTHVDSMYRRFYAVKDDSATTAVSNGHWFVFRLMPQQVNNRGSVLSTQVFLDYLLGGETGA